jgi:hypothetical protein
LPRGTIKKGTTAFNITSHLNCIYTGCANEAEWVAFLKEQYAKGTPLMILAELANPIRTDISQLWKFDNIIELRKNDAELWDYIYFTSGSEINPVPTSITYMRKEAAQ